MSRKSFKYTVQGADTTTQPATISYHNVDVTVRQRKVLEGRGLPCITVQLKHVLQGVSGIMKPGMNAIMGPSGAGKSTLLDVLAKRRFPTSPGSRVALNGQSLPENYNLVSGYVTQDIMIMGTLTVRENLHFSASLRLPSHKSSVDRENRVTELLEDLDLEVAADTKVGSLVDVGVGRGVSGGERKRTQIGMELIPEPGIIYLDEPTSGLDSFTAFSVIKLLRKLVNNVFATVHMYMYTCIFNM
jgi:ATP-binding cassette subfamily G (WHITE) protein 2